MLPGDIRRFAGKLCFQYAGIGIRRAADAAAYSLQEDCRNGIQPDTQEIRAGCGAFYQLAVGRVVENGIRHLPIMDETGSLVGIVSIKDLVWAMRGPEIEPGT